MFYVHQFQKLADPAAFTAAEDVHAIGEALLKKALVAVWNKFYDTEMPWPTPDSPDGMCFPLRGVGYMADAFVFERSLARMAFRHHQLLIMCFNSCIQDLDQHG